MDKTIKKRLIQIVGSKNFRENEPMSRHTSFQIGGPAESFVEVTSLRTLVMVITETRKMGIPSFLLGGGANILVGDKGIAGVVIHNQTAKMSLIGKDRIRAESGAVNAGFASFAARNGLTGAEFLLAIPGTVGSAVRQNCHFRNPQSFSRYFVDFTKVTDCFVLNIVETVEILTPDGQIKTVGRAYLGTDYHQSRLRETGDLVLAATFRLKKTNPKTISDLMRIMLEWRAKREFIDPSTGRVVARPKDPVTGHINIQPQLPSAGCVFSNLPNADNHPAGRLIDLAGLRCYKIGKAMFSPEHANYIVNLGGAKAADVLALINLAKEKVEKQFGLKLREEIVLVGEF